jgi:two-component system, NarL family, sensor histidine kinase DesK
VPGRIKFPPTAPAPADTVVRRRRWFAVVARLGFPSIFLVFILQTVSGVALYRHGALAVVGYVGIAAFAAVYVATLNFLMLWQLNRFWTTYPVLVAICAVEVVIAHQYAFSMFVFLGVPLIALRGGRAMPAVAALVAIAFFLPPLVPSWHRGVDFEHGFSTALILLAMFAMFGVINTNRALLAARAEIGRLAAENERNRIARDLHDLLGHSLTAITVKAALARRLATTDPQRATIEIGEVEQLTRRALAEVRTAVAGYHDVTLTDELATGQEILRAAGIDADVPDTVTITTIDPSYAEVFGWVAREAITNVVRHSRATTCTVRVGPSWIEIRDDGHGSPDVPPTSGTGLRGLGERVHACGGRLTAGPSPRRGWTTRADMADTSRSTIDASNTTSTSIASTSTSTSTGDVEARTP